MKRILAYALMLMMVVSLFGACSPAADKEETKKQEETDKQEDKTQTEDEKEEGTKENETAATIRLGMLTPTNGDLAVYGQAVLNAANLAIEAVNAEGGINGQQVELIYYDNEGDPTKSINLFHRLVDEDKIVALIGPVISATSLVVGPEAEDAGIPMITPTGTSIDITPGLDMVFRACYTDPYQGKIIGKFAAENLKAKTTVVFRNVSSDYSMGIADAFKQAFTGEVLADESYNNEDNDFKAIIAKIVDLKPDTILLPDYFNKVGLIATQLREAGVDSVLLGVDGWDGVQKEYITVTEGGYFVNHYSTTDESEVVQGFISSYKAKYDEEPNALAALGFDATKIMMEAIKTAGSTENEAIVKALNEAELEGVTGRIKFDENGDAIKSVSIIHIKDAKFELVDKVSE